MGKVLRIDRPAAGGFVSLTALRAEGCGIALTGDEYIAACQRQALRYNLPALTVILSEAKNLGTQYI